MDFVREPILNPVSISSLRPTQFTLGIREVNEKRERWRKYPDKKKAEFLGRHMMPVVLGPKRNHYIIDHHHLARALHDEGEKDVLVVVVENLSKLDRNAFWTVLDHHGWVHPYDTKGRRRNYEKLPISVVNMKNDPFRSLAGELRRAGGFAKDTAPFSEFLWADFLRRRIKKSKVEHDFDRALELASKMARSVDADYLPGWCGPVSS